jgi:glycosyltransferase involved in cell wall biosynthesis
VRVLQVITTGEPGGAQTHVATLCRAVAPDAELAAAIGSCTGRSPLGEELAALGVRVFHLPELRNSTNPLAMLRAASRVATLVRQTRPDVVHAHSSFAGVAARIAAHRCGCPAVYTVHGFGFKPQAQRFVRQAAWAGEALLAPWTSHMICVSQHEASLARGLPRAPRALSVIPNGLPDVAARADAGHVPASIAMVARLAPPKRPDLLLDALALMPGPLRTIIMGDGPERTRLEAQARVLGLKDVGFTGSVADVPQRLAAHAMFVLLSDHEGLPISIIEAMRAGLAIVATRLPGIEELVVDGESALLVENNPRQVADALARLASDPALRERLGAAARRRFELGFEAQAMARAVLGVYRSLARDAE